MRVPENNQKSRNNNYIERQYCINDGGDGRQLSAAGGGLELGGYIRIVQHLVEKCLLLRMDRDGCVNALAQHANIPPIVTLTVWKELLKENTDFFRAYFLNRSQSSDGDLRFTRRK